MQAVVPLAGKGTRLRPLTHTRPKPLVRVANRPVLSYVVEQLRDEGVDELICITGHLGEQIEEFLAEEYPDLDARYVEQERQLGTADAVALARPHVEGPFLVVFVDTLFDADLGLLRRRPDDEGILWACAVDNPEEFGVIVTDEDGYMRRIDEKPDEPESNLANIGVYFIRDHELLFEGIDEVLAGEPYLGEYFLTEAFQYMADRGARLYTAPVQGWWDCGKPETVLETNRVLLERGRAKELASPGARATGPVRVEEDVRLEGAEVGPNVSVAAGAVIRDSRLENCIVGRDARVVGCRLRNSLVGDGAEARGVDGRVLLGDDSRVEGGTGA